VVEHARVAAIRWSIVVVAGAAALILPACGGASATGEGASAKLGADLRAVSVSGSRVRLALPRGFCRPTRQLALVNREGIALVLIEGNLPSQTTARDWFAGLQAEMKKWATGPVETKEVKKAGAASTLTRMSLGKDRTMVADIAGDNGAFATVIATYNPTLEKTAEAVVSAVELDVRAPLDPFAMLGLRLPDTAGFEVAAGPVPPVVLKEKAPAAGTLGATYSVAVLPAPATPAVAAADALRAVLAAQLAVDSVDVVPEAVAITTIDGMVAAETAANDPGGANFYAAALMDRGAILLFKGRTSAEHADLVDRFKSMTRAVSRVPDALKSLACE
jgi:hypothetical protein